MHASTSAIWALSLGLTLATTSSTRAQESSSISASLSYQAAEEWTWILPRETWRKAESHCGVAHQGDAAGFAVFQSGEMALSVDANGDGRLEEKVKGQGGFLKLRGMDAEGDSFTYAVRFRFRNGYEWSSSGFMAGTLLGQTVRVVDQNLNGRYDDYGVDALIIGSTRGAALLSRVVNLGGELHDLEVSPDGATVKAKPWSGAAATLNLASKFASQGELVSAVVKSGNTSFNLAGAKSGLKVPAGRYEFVHGWAEKGGETVAIRTGRMQPIDLKSGDDALVAWGGPIVAEFDYEKEGETVTVQPNLRFYGEAGEEYGPFQPDAKSPKIIVTDKKTRKILASGRFGGC